MATPGFSISELIEAAAKTKRIYDAFFHQYDNASNRVRDLADTVHLFQLNLTNHQWLIEQSGRTYPGLDAFNRTLTECNEFIRRYERLLHESQSKTKDAIKIMNWTFEDRKIGNLRWQLQMHIQALNGYTLSLLLHKVSSERDHIPAASSHTTSYTSNTLNLHVNQLPSSMGDLQLEDARRTPQRLLTAPEDNEHALNALWRRAELLNNRIKRSESQRLQQSQQHLSPTAASSRRDSIIGLQSRQEIQRLIEQWTEIAQRNGVDPRHIPQINLNEPLGTAEEFAKRVLHASDQASRSRTPPSPIPPPRTQEGGFPESPVILPVAPSGSTAPQTPSDSIWTHTGSIDTRTPVSHIQSQSGGGLEPLDLPPPGVLDCNAHLTLRHRTSKYPTLELKRLEIKQANSSNEILIVCTTTKNVQIQHRLPRGADTHPYTKHKSLNRPHEVSFLEHHSIIRGSTTYTGDPTYKFFTDLDCKIFQDSIRGKDLVHTFEVDKIAMDSSNRLGEATDQHLKIWRDFDGGQFSITFFANNPSDGLRARHREFPLTRLELAASTPSRRRTGTVRLEFRPLARRPSQPASPFSGTGLGIGDLRGLPMGAEAPSAIASSPAGPSPSRSPFPISSGSPTPEAEQRSPTIGPPPSQQQREKRRKGSRGGSIDAGTSMRLEEGDSPPEEKDARLKWMDISFTDASDSERFAALFPHIQHI